MVHCTILFCIKPPATLHAFIVILLREDLVLVRADLRDDEAVRVFNQFVEKVH